MMRGMLFGLLAGWLPAHWIGDLEEEAAEHGGWWLARQAFVAAGYGARMRLVSANLLESTAAAALLVGLPLVIVLVLRRFVLTLIPFRESAAYSLAAVAILALLTAALGWALTVALSRRWMPVASAGLLTAGVVLLLGAPMILTVAAFAGGWVATVGRRGETA